MKKTVITPDKLEEIASFRKKKLPWTIISRITGVERRVAKREYEDWEKYCEIEHEKYNLGYKSGYRQGYKQGFSDGRKAEPKDGEEGG